MQITKSCGMVVKLRSLTLSLSLILFNAQPAHAQPSRNSATNGVTNRATPTPLPTAGFSPSYNSCLAPMYESTSGGVPYTGVCEREWVSGQYVCRHFARDFCAAILSNRSNQEMGSGCWILTLSPDYSSPKKVIKIASCVAAECGISWLSARTADLATGGDKIAHFVSRATCSEKERKCVYTFVGTGHAINIFRSGGRGFLDRSGQATFMAVEPQHPDGGSAVLCTWTQKTLEPVLPDWCKEHIAEDIYPGQVTCGIPYQFTVWDLNTYVAHVTRQDNFYRSETFKP